MLSPSKPTLHRAFSALSCLFLVSSPHILLAGSSELTVNWDPTQAKPTCTTKEKGGATKVEPCSGVSLRPGQLLVVTVTPALPALYDYSTATEDQSTQSVAAGRLPWPAPKTKGTSGGPESAPQVQPTVLGCSEIITEADLKPYLNLFVLDEAAQKRVRSSLVAAKLEAYVERVKILPADQPRESVKNLDAAMKDCKSANKGDVVLSGTPPSEGASKTASVSAAYATLVTSAERLEDALMQHELGALDSLLVSARGAETRLFGELQLPLGTSGEGVAAALENTGVIEAGAKADLVARLKTLRTLLHELPLKAGEVVIFVKEFGDQDFTLRLKAEPTSKLPGGVKRLAFLRVSLRYRWSYSLTSGVMFSGLVGTEYSRKTVVDERNPDGTTKRSHSELAQESSDRLSTEAALLGALFPIHDSWASNIGLVLGLGLDSEAAARYYGGVGFRLGRVGLLSLGAATGKVKTLKESVNVKDAGDIEPSDAVRDRRTTAFFLGLSFGFGQ